MYLIISIIAFQPQSAIRMLQYNKIGILAFIQIEWIIIRHDGKLVNTVLLKFQQRKIYNTEYHTLGWR